MMQLRLLIVFLLSVILFLPYPAAITTEVKVKNKCNNTSHDDDGRFPICLTAENNNSRTMDLSFKQVKFTAMRIAELVLELEITLLCIISDRIADPLVNAVLHEMKDPSMRVMIYSVDTSNPDSIMEAYVATMKLRTDQTLTMVLCGHLANTLTIFKSLRVLLDQTKQTGIEHNTRWLVAISSSTYLDELEIEIAPLDNVVVVADKECDFQTTECLRLGIYTMRIESFQRFLGEIGSTTEDCQVLLNDTLYPNADRGFNGRHFTIGLYVWDPFTMRINKTNGVPYEGFCVDLVQELSVRLNFRYSLTEPADNNWGSLLPNGNWTGLVGMLQRHEIDVSVAAMIITEERETVMDGTFPFYYDHVGVLYKRLDPEDSMWKTYLHPFKPEVFMWIGLSVIYSCVVYLLLSLLSPSGPGVHNTLFTFLGYVSHAASQVDNVVAAVFQQGRPDLPSHGSGQVFLAFWWLFLMITAAIYKGNLIAFLMVPQEDVPFTTLEGLATQDVYRWGVTGSTVVEYLFQVSQRPDFKRLGMGIERFKASDKDINSLDPLVHLAKVKNGFYAYISDTVPMEIWMSEDCNLRLLEQTVIPLPFVVGLQNNSGFLRLFNEQLLDIDQMGLYGVWKQRWWPEMGQCSADSRTAKKVLSVVETQSSFYILCIGLLLALVSLLFEYFVTTKVFKAITSSFHCCFVKLKNIFMTCRRHN